VNVEITRHALDRVPLSLIIDDSTVLVNRLREEKSVLIVPGDHFGMDGYLRIGTGAETGYLKTGLERLRELLVALGARA
jgi:aspartate/methionine/tyrosine aminotransferase